MQTSARPRQSPRQRSRTANYVAIYNGSAQLSSEQYLGAARGGTGNSSAAASGIPHVSTGTWTYSAIVDADVSASAAITSTKIAGTANYAAYYNGSAQLASEQYLSNVRGGTGANSSAFTGVAKVAAGVWSASTIVDADVSASAAITSTKIAGTANYAAYYNGSAQLASEQYVAASRGGTGASSAASTGYGYVRGGTWEFGNSPILAANASSQNQTKPVYVATTTAAATVIDNFDMALTGYSRMTASYHINIVLNDSTNSKYGCYDILGTVKWDGTTMTIDTAMEKSKRLDAGLGTTDVTVTWTSGSTFQVNVVGIAATNIFWSGSIVYNKQGRV
jgi:dihydroneopterin aldolase